MPITNIDLQPLQSARGIEVSPQFPRKAIHRTLERRVIIAIIEQQMRSDISPRISRRIVRHRLKRLHGELLNEPNAGLSVRVLVVEAVEVGEPGLEGRDVVGLDATAVDVLVEAFDAGVGEGAFGAEEGGG